MGTGFYPAMGGGGFARAQELGPWLDLIALRARGWCKFWLKPGESAVTLGTVEEREEERIPGNLDCDSFPFTLNTLLLIMQ